MKVLLTGVSSFIGSELGAFLHEQGYTVCGTVRKDRYASFRPFWLEKSFILDLREAAGKVDISTFDGVDVVVHLAHDFREDMVDVNVEATKSIAENAGKARVGRQIFFSSYSARPDAVSEYGLIKYRLEQYFLKEKHVVVRPGLVIGRGGVFLKFFNAVKRFPVIPLPNGGKERVPIISMRQLCEVIHKVISSPSSSQIEFNIFYPDMTTMKTLINAMKTVSGSRALLLPFPSGILIGASNLCKALGIKLPFNVDSLKSFRKNQQRIHLSNIDTMLDRYDSVTDAVMRALAESRG